MKKPFAIFVSFLFFIQPLYAAARAPSIINKSTSSDITDKEIIIPQEDLIAAEQYNEENNAFVKFIEQAVSSAPKENETKSVILEAEALYKKTVESFKNGKTDDAKKYFSLFINKLEKSKINPGIYFFMFDEFDSLMTKLKRIYSVDAPGPVLESEKTEIPMECADNSHVERYIRIYSTSYRKSMKAAIERSGAYREMILKTLQSFNLPEELQYLPIVESLFHNFDVSKAGAAGLWQIMPHRGRALGLQINYWIDERRDPEKATKAACLYLKELYIMLNDWHLVLAAYNRGEFGIIRDMKFSNASNISEMTDRNAIPKETQRYVPQFIAVVTIVKNLEEYGFDPEEFNYAKPQVYDTVKTDKVIDLKIAAQCAETTLEEIKKLNPALNAWCTPQGYPGFELKIPYGSKAKFLENIAQVKDLNPSPGFIKYKVVKGDFIERIAAKYKTTVREIYKDNPKIAKQKYLQIGQVLTIRPGRKYYK
ncbi:MAG: transglycosylase SLT domain-containing protein [Endomicrobia bacterium]|nr:transglycosylase SLT domain-containing protein [Endomicrobiia bacterium]MCL2799492.1 transglycosylase SLT domain-containing protein [Endomicrobiia bacterium]